MPANEGMVQPLSAPRGVPGKFSALMVSHPADLSLIKGKSGKDPGSGVRVMMSRLFFGDGKTVVIGPFMGAPYAAALLENLISWGASAVVCFGWCGAVSRRLEVGDLVIPDKAIIEEGTSRGYLPAGTEASYPDAGIHEELSVLAARGGFSGCRHAGAVWTTDALFNETPEKVRRYERLGAIAVDMETSALFTVAARRGVPAGAVLVVSDTLYTGAWRPGFASPAFKNARREAAGMLCAFLQSL